MIGRFFYFVFLVLGGIFFVPFKWILVGTKGSRDRKKLLKAVQEGNRR